jgi:hypothetical protein
MFPKRRLTTKLATEDTRFIFVVRIYSSSNKPALWFGKAVANQITVARSNTTV